MHDGVDGTWGRSVGCMARGEEEGQGDCARGVNVWEGGNKKAVISPQVHWTFILGMNRNYLCARHRV